MTAGALHTIRIEFWEDGGAATARLLWQSQSQEKAVVSQAHLEPPDPAQRGSTRSPSGDRVGYVVELSHDAIHALPKSAHPTAPRMLAEIRDAEDRDHALRAVNAFAYEFGAKWPKAVAKIVDDTEELLAFYEFPAEHWIHLKTSNAIESTFSTVRLRTRVTKGSGSRAAGLAMAFKLLESAQQRWRYVNAPHLVALVRAGAKFEKGVLIERPNDRIRKPPRSRRET